MKNFCRLLTGLLLLFPLIGTGIPSLQPVADDLAAARKAVLYDGEYLVYEVSWTFLKLGTIRLRAHRNYTAEAYIDSYEGLHLVDLHSFNHTRMDSSFYSLGSHAIDKKDTMWAGLDYISDPARGLVRMEEIRQSDIHSPPYLRVTRDSIKVPTMRFLDGLCIGYFPRAYIRTRDTLNVPTILYGKLGTTTFCFSGDRTTEQIDAVDKPVRVVKVPGTTSVEGIYGMTGAFTGWFSDDSAAVPIKGKLKVLIGNVTVELIQWKRDAWNPPTAE